MCKIKKSFDEFSNSAKDKEHKKQYHCKKCQTLYKQKNRERVAKLAKNNHIKDYRKNLVRAAKHRAKNKNVPFDITWEDLELINVCPVLGIPIFTKTLNNQNAPSIDRFIPKLGYVKENVFIISKRANTLKGDATINEVKLILKYMNDGLHYE